MMNALLSDDEERTVRAIISGILKGIWEPTESTKKFVGDMLWRLIMANEMANEKAS